MTGVVNPPEALRQDRSRTAPLGGPARRHLHLGRDGPWLRWSARDLRRRWVQVAAIALVAGLGAGTYVGLTSTTQWRRQSYDASYAALNAHTLSVSMATGTAAPADQLIEATRRVPHPEWIQASSVQLVVPVQVDASTNGSTVLVPGRVVGVDVTSRGPAVDRFDVRAGRGLAETDQGTGRAVIDTHFAEYHGLPAPSTVKVSGDRPVDVVGQVLEPEYFMVLSEQGGFFAAAGYAVMFMPLPDAQALAGKPGQADRLVVRLRDGVDEAAAQAELEQALAATVPGAATEVTPITQDRAYRILYDDIDGDQRFYRIFAILILAGAAFAAFNLASRIVESQRREIGVGMALGVPTPWIAFRPLLVGLEVALLSTAFGIVVGLAIGQLMAGVMEEFFPLPVWQTPFQFGTYLVGALLCVGLLFVATVWPVLRAVRVAPVDAIQVGLRETKSSGWARAARRVPLPGNTLVQMPLRNALRSPRRSLLTALGIAAAIATLVAVLGMVDSFDATIDAAEAELLQSTPERLEVSIDGFLPSGSPVLADLQGLPGVAATSEGLRVVGQLGPPTGAFDAILQFVRFDDPVWAPTIVEGRGPGDEPSVVISRKAAEDLGVGPGGTIHLRHPYREGLGYRWVESDFRVAGIHANALRSMVYFDQRQASVMNLQGLVNVVEVKPAPGVPVESVQRELFHQAGVASVQPVAAITRVIRDRIGQFLDILAIIQYAVLLLAVLIAFNSSSISADERAREHATMFAFGLPPRATLGMAMAESALVGVVATVIGVLAGIGLLGWIIRVLLAETLPDLSMEIAVRPATIVTAVLMGVVAVAVAPVLTLRKLRRMPIPDTLRVVE